MTRLNLEKPLVTAKGQTALFVERLVDPNRKYPVVVTIDGVLHTYTDDGRFLNYVEKCDLDLRNAA